MLQPYDAPGQNGTGSRPEHWRKIVKDYLPATCMLIAEIAQRLTESMREGGQLALPQIAHVLPRPWQSTYSNFEGQERISVLQTVESLLARHYGAARTQPPNHEMKTEASHIARRLWDSALQYQESSAHVQIGFESQPFPLVFQNADGSTFEIYHPVFSPLDLSALRGAAYSDFATGLNLPECVM